MSRVLRPPRANMTDSIVRPMGTHFATVMVSWLVYAVAYPLLSDILAPHASVLAFVPVVVTGWYGGAIAGCVAGLASVPVTALVAIVTGLGAGSGLTQSVLIGAVAMMLVGYVVGHVRDLNGRIVQQNLERQQDEGALRDSEARFRTLLDHQLDGVVVVTDGQIVYANPTACRIFGHEERDLLGSEASSFFVAADRPHAQQRMTDLATGAVDMSTAEYTAVRGNGTTFPLEVTCRQISYDGQLALLGQLRDITNRKAQETAIREAEEKYRSLVENSLAGVSIVQNRRLKYVNPRLAEILGYTQAELLGLSSFLDVVYEDDREVAEEKYKQRLEGDVETAHYTIRACRKDGQVIDVEVNGSVTRYLGEPALIGTMLDVTERRRAYQQLRESEKRFRTLFERSPAGIVMASVDTRIQRVNAAFCDMLGYTKDELIGRSIVDITHPDDPAGTFESAAKVFEDAEFVTRVHKRYKRKSGGLVQAETTVSVIKNDDGRPLYVVAMVQDVTEQRQLEEQLHQILRLESVGQLAGGVAHNFNNALTAISGYSELLARRFDAEDPALRDLEQIQRVAEQSAQLTQQLLAFSRAEHLRPAVFSLNDSVESTRDLLSPILGDDLRIHLRLDRDLPNVSSDRSQIEQVITNLVLNARDAMPEGGVVTIETKAIELDGAAVRTNPEAKPGRYARLTVADTGTGMDGETVTRVFEPFFTTKEPGRGVGLGLAMVHGVVMQSRGFISVQSTPTAGSTFAVHLPEAHTIQEPHKDADTIH